ncbi:hypothetical protein LIER_11947 [Lithospermum erythrorhizon]|uniref:Zinc knuckle CX2CX4HX4C domain-containing protein n=1 Tax=Lithospermum erythrorhizon TaxID=34254 RepID=A0AAV3PQD6_LITER
MDAEIIQELLGFDTCDFWIQVRGLKDEYLTRDVAGKIGNAFQDCESVELKFDKQGKKFFRLKATVMIHQPIRRLVNFKFGSSMVSGYLTYEMLRNMCFYCEKLGYLIKQCLELDPGEDCTTKVVYGLWIKAPLERLLQIRDTDLVVDDPLGEEILSEEVAEYPVPPQTLVGRAVEDPILEVTNKEGSLVDPQSKDHEPNGPLGLQARNSTKNKEDSGLSNTRKETLAFFNFNFNNGPTTKGKAPMLKPQSKMRHHPYQTAKNLSSPSKKLAISNVEGEVFSTTNKSTEQPHQQ